MRCDAMLGGRAPTVSSPFPIWEREAYLIGSIWELYCLQMNRQKLSAPLLLPSRAVLQGAPLQLGN